MVGDAWSRALANDYSLNARWQQYFDRIFGMRGLGLQIPYSNSATVDQVLIA